MNKRMTSNRLPALFLLTSTLTLTAPSMFPAVFTFVASMDTNTAQT
jgi:hypothetical protein|tara:strand:+ start:157 stop:294 length:138 start_codon:yes stop_codon:yes gene_type:complete